MINLEDNVEFLVINSKVLIVTVRINPEYNDRIIYVLFKNIKIFNFILPSHLEFLILDNDIIVFNSILPDTLRCFYIISKHLKKLKLNRIPERFKYSRPSCLKNIKTFNKKKFYITY